MSWGEGRRMTAALTCVVPGVMRSVSPDVAGEGGLVLLFLVSFVLCLLLVLWFVFVRVLRVVPLVALALALLLVAFAAFFSLFFVLRVLLVLVGVLLVAFVVTVAFLALFCLFLFEGFFVCLDDFPVSDLAAPAFRFVGGEHGVAQEVLEVQA